MHRVEDVARPRQFIGAKPSTRAVGASGYFSTCRKVCRARLGEVGSSIRSLASLVMNETRMIESQARKWKGVTTDVQEAK